jgi:hypothetical protein
LAAKASNITFAPVDFALAPPPASAADLAKAQNRAVPATVAISGWALKPNKP